MQQICSSDKAIHQSIPTGEKNLMTCNVNVINCREHNFERSELTDYFIRLKFHAPRVLLNVFFLERMPLGACDILMITAD